MVHRSVTPGSFAPGVAETVVTPLRMLGYYRQFHSISMISEQRIPHPMSMNITSSVPVVSGVRLFPYDVICYIIFAPNWSSVVVVVVMLLVVVLVVAVVVVVVVVV